MKNLTLFLLIGSVFMFISGCKSSERATKATEQAQVLVPKSYKVWRQRILPSLAVGYPANFLNSAEIILEGDIFLNQKMKLEDGKFVRVYDVHPVSKNVPVNTLGELVFPLVKDRNGNIIQMNLSFSFEDASYIFNFQRRLDGSFILNGNATVRLSDGKEYPIQASSRGECILLIDFSDDPTVIPETGTAEGRQATGTMEIKIR